MSVSARERERARAYVDYGGRNDRSGDGYVYVTTITRPIYFIHHNHHNLFLLKIIFFSTPTRYKIKCTMELYSKLFGVYVIRVKT